MRSVLAGSAAAPDGGKLTPLILQPAVTYRNNEDQCVVLAGVCPDCGSVQPLYCRLTPVHGAPFGLRGGGRCVAIGQSEVGGQGVG